MRFSAEGLISLVVLTLIGIYVASRMRKEKFMETITAITNSIKGGGE